MQGPSEEINVARQIRQPASSRENAAQKHLKKVLEETAKEKNYMNDRETIMNFLKSRPANVQPLAKAIRDGTLETWVREAIENGESESD